MPSETRSPSSSDNRGAGDDNAFGHDDEEKPRLTEDQRKANHIASEKKRRQAIRDAYEQLTEIVPGTAGMARSEGVVLRATLDHIKNELEKRKRLIHEIEMRGERVDDADKQALLQLQMASSRTNERWVEEQKRK